MRRECWRTLRTLNESLKLLLGGLLAVGLLACEEQPTEDEEAAPVLKAQLSLNVPGDYTFRQVNIGTTKEETLTVTNVGNVKATNLSIQGLTAPFGFKGGSYPGTGGNCTDRLEPNESCQFVMTFTPSSLGEVSSQVSLNYLSLIEEMNFTLEVSGTGTGTPGDTTPPTPPSNLTYQSDGSPSSSAQFSWTAGSDETAFSHYEAAIGTVSGGSGVQAWSNIGNVTLHQFTGLSLNYFTDYFTSVRSVDMAGNVSTVVTSAAWQIPDPAPPQIIGVSASSTPVKSVNWNWSCDQTCQFRYRVSQNASEDLSGDTYSSSTSASQASGDGVYYLHVQARDTSYLQESGVTIVSAVLDNTVPADPGTITISGQGTETSSAPASWGASSDETAFSHYEMAIGTLSGGTEVLNWTSIGAVTSYTRSGLSLSDGIDYYTSIRAVDVAGNISGEISSGAWVVPGPPAAINSLGVVSAAAYQIQIGWAAPNNNGSPITDYLIEYKASTLSGWTVVNDGVSTETQAVVTGLDPSTSYDFRVQAYNGSTGGYSNIATGSTTPDDPFFDPTEYKAINLGGATASQVVALEDGTEIKLNDVTLVTLNAGETHGFTSALNDILSSTQPFFAAGKNGSGADNNQGNMVWSPPDWAGKEFIFTGTRDNPHIVTVYAFEDAAISITQGGSPVDSANVLTGNNHTFSINANGGFKMVSTGLIVAYFYSGGGGTRVVDPKPLLPASMDILGFPSSSLKLTSWTDNNDYVGFHSSSVSISGTVNEGDALTINPQGTSSLYQSESLRITAAEKVVGNSNADSNGYCSAPFIPTSMLKKRYANNVDAEWIAFASLEAGTITVTAPGGATSTVDLVKSGSEPNAPYRARLTLKGAGHIFESGVRFGAWYEPSTNTNAADNDETLMFGFDFP